LRSEEVYGLWLGRRDILCFDDVNIIMQNPLMLRMREDEIKTIFKNVEL